jgi:hypothetical protein
MHKLKTEKKVETSLKNIYINVLRIRTRTKIISF